MQKFQKIQEINKFIYTNIKTDVEFTSKTTMKNKTYHINRIQQQKIKSYFFKFYKIINGEGIYKSDATPSHVTSADSFGCQLFMLYHMEGTLILFLDLSSLEFTELKKHVYSRCVLENLHQNSFLITGFNAKI